MLSSFLADFRVLAGALVFNTEWINIPFASSLIIHSSSNTALSAASANNLSAVVFRLFVLFYLWVSKDTCKEMRLCQFPHLVPVQLQSAVLTAANTTYKLFPVLWPLDTFCHKLSAMFWHSCSKWWSLVILTTELLLIRKTYSESKITVFIRC